MACVVCGVPASRRCTLCTLPTALYCCAAHEFSHWAVTHKLECPLDSAPIDSHRLAATDTAVLHAEASRRLRESSDAARDAPAILAMAVTCLRRSARVGDIGTAPDAHAASAQLSDCVLMANVLRAAGDADGAGFFLRAAARIVTTHPRPDPSENREVLAYAANMASEMGHVDAFVDIKTMEHDYLAGASARLAANQHPAYSSSSHHMADALMAARAAGDVMLDIANEHLRHGDAASAMAAWKRATTTRDATLSLSQALHASREYKGHMPAALEPARLRKQLLAHHQLGAALAYAAGDVDTAVYAASCARDTAAALGEDPTPYSFLAGNALRLSGRYNEALPHLAAAYETRLAQHGDTHEATIAARRFMNHARKNLGMATIPGPASGAGGGGTASSGTGAGETGGAEGGNALTSMLSSLMGASTTPNGGSGSGVSDSDLMSAAMQAPGDEGASAGPSGGAHGQGEAADNVDMSDGDGGDDGAGMQRSDSTLSVGGGGGGDAQAASPGAAAMRASFGASAARRRDGSSRGRGGGGGSSGDAFAGDDDGGDFGLDTMDEEPFDTTTADDDAFGGEDDYGADENAWDDDMDADGGGGGFGGGSAGPSAASRGQGPSAAASRRRAAGGGPGGGPDFNAPDYDAPGGSDDENAFSPSLARRPAAASRLPGALAFGGEPAGRASPGGASSPSGPMGSSGPGGMDSAEAWGSAGPAGGGSTGGPSSGFDTSMGGMDMFGPAGMSSGPGGGGGSAGPLMEMTDINFLLGGGAAEGGGSAGPMGTDGSGAGPLAADYDANYVMQRANAERVDGGRRSSRRRTVVHTDGDADSFIGTTSRASRGGGMDGDDRGGLEARTGFAPRGAGPGSSRLSISVARSFGDSQANMYATPHRGMGATPVGMPPRVSPGMFTPSAAGGVMPSPTGDAPNDFPGYYDAAGEYHYFAGAAVGMSGGAMDFAGVGVGPGGDDDDGDEYLDSASDDEDAGSLDETDSMAQRRRRRDRALARRAAAAQQASYGEQLYLGPVPAHARFAMGFAALGVASVGGTMTADAAAAPPPVFRTEAEAASHLQRVTDKLALALQALVSIKGRKPAARWQGDGELAADVGAQALAGREVAAAELQDSLAAAIKAVASASAATGINSDSITGSPAIAHLKALLEGIVADAATAVESVLDNTGMSIGSLADEAASAVAGDTPATAAVRRVAAAAAAAAQTTAGVLSDPNSSMPVASRGPATAVGARGGVAAGAADRQAAGLVQPGLVKLEDNSDGRRMKAVYMSGEDIMRTLQIRLLALGMFKSLGSHYRQARVAIRVLFLATCMRSVKAREASRRAIKAFALGVPLRALAARNASRRSTKTFVAGMLAACIRIRDAHRRAVKTLAVALPVYALRRFRAAVHAAAIFFAGVCVTDHRTQGKPVGYKYGQKPKPYAGPKMRQVRWEPLQADATKGSVWARPGKGGAMRELFPDLLDLFAEKEKAKPGAAGAAGAAAGAPAAADKDAKKPKVTFVEGKRAQNMAIAVACFKKNDVVKREGYAAVRAALERMDDELLGGVDGLAVLESWEPESGEVARVKELTAEEKENLGDAEKWVAAMAGVKQFKPRVAALRVKGTFAELVAKTEADIAKFNAACHEILDNTRLREFLVDVVLPFGNALNRGQKTANAKGVRVSALTALKATKTADNKMSSLEYIITVLATRRPELLSIRNEFKVVKDCTQMVLASVSADVETLRKNLGTLQTQLETAQAPATRDEPFVDAIEPFLERANREYKLLKERYDELIANVGKTCEYLVEKEQMGSPETLFRMWTEFIKAFEEEYQSYLKKKAAADKKARLEAEKLAKEAKKSGKPAAASGDAPAPPPERKPPRNSKPPPHPPSDKAAEGKDAALAPPQTQDGRQKRASDAKPPVQAAEVPAKAPVPPAGPPPATALSVEDSGIASQPKPPSRPRRADSVEAPPAAAAAPKAAVDTPSVPAKGPVPPPTPPPPKQPSQRDIVPPSTAPPSTAPPNGAPLPKPAPPVSGAPPLAPEEPFRGPVDGSGRPLVKRASQGESSRGLAAAAAAAAGPPPPRPPAPPPPAVPLQPAVAANALTMAPPGPRPPVAPPVLPPPSAPGKPPAPKVLGPPGMPSPPAAAPKAPAASNRSLLAAPPTGRAAGPPGPPVPKAGPPSVSGPPRGPAGMLPAPPPPPPPPPPARA